MEFPFSPTPDPLPKGEGEERKNPPLGGGNGWGEFGYQTADPVAYRALQEKAVGMRQNPTEAEEKLWQELRDNKLGCHFRRQHIIGKFIVDFVCLEKMLVVEVDGDVHDYQKESDEERTKYLAQLGYKLIRFSNEEVLNNIKKVLEQINLALPLGEGAGGVIKVFTTRPETIFGATYLAIAGKTDKFTGQYVTNPATGEEIPVWEAEYVMSDVGTGALMGVPAHDERDFAFAQKHNLPIREVVTPKMIDTHDPPREGVKTVARNAIQAIIINPKNQKVLCLKWKKFPWTTFITGGIEGDEDMVEAAKREITEETGYKNVKYVKTLGGPVESHFFANHKNENRKAVFHALVFELENEEQQELSEEEKQIHEVVWLTWDELAKDKNIKCSEYELWLDRFFKPEHAWASEGVMINSSEFSGLDSVEAREKIIAKFGTAKTTYKLRDWIFSRQRYWGEPIPMIFCSKCDWQPVPESDLPVILPEVKEYQPRDDGESPLASVSEWVNVKCPKCGGEARRETDTMPNWAGSSWYYLRYCDPENAQEFASEEKLQYWLGKTGTSLGGVDWYNGGMEHTTLHLLYSRFWHKFLFDLKLVPNSEPYQKRTSHGLILAEGGVKMSKSKPETIINPDKIVGLYGADTLRLYEMFMGPFEQAVAWNTESIIGPRRFLERVWKLSDNLSEKTAENLADSVQKITSDIESLKFNTAISGLMILLNTFEKEGVSKTDYEVFLKLLAPFAPHIAEELWQKLGHNTSIHQEKWPELSESGEKTTTREQNIMIQVNGIIRDKIVLSGGQEATEEIAKNMALQSPKVQKWLDNKTVKKVVYIPGRLLNFVIYDNIKT
ncbi:MAG: DUF559 domain-containing protein [Patescibacteria group bacterium]